MALKATVFKAQLQISNMDGNYFRDHALTIARHPSETDERMMLRVLAFACHASESLSFGAGLSTDDEPDLWERDLTGAIDLWIDIGQPDEKLLRRASGRAQQVVVYAYGGQVAEQWWRKNQANLERIRNLTVMNVPLAASRSLAALAQRNMQLRCAMQEQHIWLSDENNEVELDLVTLKPDSAYQFGS